MEVKISFKHSSGICLYYIFLVIFISSYIFTSRAQNYQHIIIYGQSLSTGYQSWPPLSTTSVANNYMIGSQIWINRGNTIFNKLTPLIANVAAYSSSFPKTRSSDIIAECPLVAATNHIQLKTGGQSRFIASSCGTDGKTIEELSKEFYNPIYYQIFTNTIKYASSITSGAIHCPAIIWMQGEYNYTLPSDNEGLTAGSKPTSDKAVYKSLLIKLKENMQADIKNKYSQTDSPLFITYQTGAQYTRGNYVSIGMAQLEASNEYKDIVCAGPIYPMTDRGGHLDPNGYRWFGEMLGKVYYKTKILGEDFKPLQPLEISRTNNPKVLRIKFLVPSLPLVLDELLVNKVTNYGFEVFLNGTEITLSTISIDNNYIYLTSTTNLNGDIEVIYAGTNNSGHGNLRDSDTYSAYYNYIDLDGKNSDGSYIYQRDASETTLRPSYEPHDNSGIIYNKKYPLYNFCVAFYYKLSAQQQTYQIPNLSTGIESTAIHNTKVYITNRILQIETDALNMSRIDITDITGKAIITYPFNKNDSQNIYYFPLPVLSKGIYLVKIKFQNTSYTTKILVP